MYPPKKPESNSAHLWAIILLKFQQEIGVLLMSWILTSPTAIFSPLYDYAQFQTILMALRRHNRLSVL